MADKEATARIKINKLLEAAGWRFFAEGSAPANIRLNDKGFDLCERFWPAIPDGVRGWGVKGELDIKLIRSLEKRAE